MVTTIAGDSLSAGTVNGFGTLANFMNPYQVALDSNGRILVADVNGNRIRLVDPAGYCGGGNYATVVGATNCASSAAGYFKPRVPFSDNYYLCPAGTFATSGSTACTSCTAGSAVTVGSTYCACPLGTYLSNGACTISPVGECGCYIHLAVVMCSCVQGSYVSTTTSTQTQSCASAAATGAATCQATAAYVSLVAGGSVSSGVLDGVSGTSVYFSYPMGITLDGDGNLFVTDNGLHTIRMIATSSTSGNYTDV